jgi:hypothetical protein
MPAHCDDLVPVDRDGTVLHEAARRKTRRVSDYVQASDQLLTHFRSPFARMGGRLLGCAQSSTIMYGRFTNPVVRRMLNDAELIADELRRLQAAPPAAQSKTTS